jgi:hypothetical protein
MICQAAMRCHSKVIPLPTNLKGACHIPHGTVTKGAMINKHYLQATGSISGGSD